MHQAADLRLRGAGSVIVLVDLRSGGLPGALEAPVNRRFPFDRHGLNPESLGLNGPKYEI